MSASITEPSDLIDVHDASPGTLIRLKTGFIGDSARGELCDNSEETSPSRCQLTTVSIRGLPIDDFDLTESGGISIGQVDIVVRVLSPAADFDVVYDRKAG